MISRRSFVGAAAAVPALAARDPRPEKNKTAFVRRNHPLDGVARENLKITNVDVTIMSYELKDKAWITGTQLIWKSDAILVQVFTDKGIVGIGESSPYGGPEYVKKAILEYVKPALIGQNPFDVEFLATAWRASPELHRLGRGGCRHVGYHRESQGPAGIQIASHRGTARAAHPNVRIRRRRICLV